MRVLECPRCGSSERRPNGKGCAECNRRASRDRWMCRPRPPEDDSDIRLTPAIRAYLAAFDEYLKARQAGDSRAARQAAHAKAAALEHVENGD